MIKLSVILPAKRKERWENLYNSIENAFSDSWELVIITHLSLPDSLKNKSNIKLINSSRAPLPKQQMGMIQSEGEYITYMSDDGVMVGGSMDRTFRLLKGKNYKFFVVNKYLEGEKTNLIKGEFKTNYDFMRDDSYYLLVTHDSSNFKYVPYSSPIMSFATISKKLMIELGGWDCQFQTCPMAYSDLAARLIKHGCEYIIQDDIVHICGHMPGTTGDHSAIHHVQTEQDEPLFQKMYGDNYIERIKIPLDNWKHSEEIWSARQKWG